MKNVLEYLEYTAGRLPDKRAVTDPETSLTFRELERKAKGVGTYLAKVCSASPGSPVGIFMGKSADALAVMLGIVYAGCFSVFLNTEQGSLRLRKMAETARLKVVLTDREEEAVQVLSEPDDPAGGRKPFQAPGADAEADFCLADALDALSFEPDEELLLRIRSRQVDTDPLYCNFTSGSTGTPKGVLVCHRSVIDFMNYFPDLFGITKNDVIGNQAPFDFDVSVKDIYSSLKTGAELVLIPRKYFTLITSLLDYLDLHKVTTLVWAVSALCLIVQLKGFSYKVPSSIKRVMFSGEVMPERFLKAWMDRYPEADFVNLYGPSEITCNCTYYRVPGEKPPEGVLPVGLPFPNEKVFLLDDEDRLVTEAGKPGQICVAGTCLALGYLNDQKATQKVFCQNPLNQEYPERIYRTGDLGYFREDGLLCFSGRSDFQIKLFGHRIEMEEVESALNSAEGVDRGFCIFNAGKDRLEGYYAGAIEPRDLKSRLQKLLPRYMVPSRFFKVDRIEMTPNGKIDRRQVQLQEDPRKAEAGRAGAERAGTGKPMAGKDEEK